MYCPDGEGQRWLPILISYGTGIVTYIVMTFVAKNCRSIPILPREPFKSSLQLLTPVMTVVGVVCFFYEESSPYGSLVRCRSPLPLEFSIFTLVKWIQFFVYVYFAGRCFISWAVECKVGVWLTILNIAFVIQAIYGIAIQQELIMFQFLIMCNCYSWEVKNLLSHLRLWINDKVFLWLQMLCQISSVTFIVGGFLRAAEEWEANESYYATFDGSSAVGNSIYIYCHMAIVTCSTVGFGDYIPLTTKLQVVVIVCAIFFVAPLANRIERLFDLNQWLVDVLNEDTNKHNFLLGVREMKDLEIFLKAFHGDKTDLLVLLNNAMEEDLTEYCEEIGICVIQDCDPASVIKSSHFKGDREDCIWFMYSAQSTDLPSVIDDYTIFLVKRIKELKCEARLFVKVWSWSRKVELASIIGWRGDCGTDVCIVSQLVNAHMLFHSSQAKLRSALLVMASYETFVIGKPSTHKDSSFFSESVREYFENGNILLGTFGDYGCSLLPHAEEYNHSSSHRLFLTTSFKERTGTRFLKQTLDATRITPSQVVIEGDTYTLKKVLEKHAVPESEGQTEEARIFFMENERQINETYLLLERKCNLGKDVRIISTLEHQYERCLLRDCVCGVFDCSYQSASFLSLAQCHPALYDLWMGVMEGDYLVADEVQKDCLYGDLFLAFAIVHQKILLGVEVKISINGSPNVQTPKLNPPPCFQVSKGDIVVSLHSQKV